MIGRRTFLFLLTALVARLVAFFSGVWTTPKTWSTGELVTASLMNSHVRDNMDFLKDPPTGLYNVNEAGDYTTTSTSFVDIDATNLSLTITTAGGDVMIGFYGSFKESVANIIYLDVDMDGSRLGGDDGIIGLRVSTNVMQDTMSFVYLQQSLSAGSHTYKLQWKVKGNTGTLHAGAGVANADVHPQFWVREVS